jgi:ectoine hydroxylase
MSLFLPLRPLDAASVSGYHENGYLLTEPGFLPDWVVPEVRTAAARLMTEDSPRRVLERDGVTVRSVYGPHQTDQVVRRVTAQPQLLGAVTQLLGDDGVYVHQSKVNLKAAFSGDQWEWHQDFVYWLQSDGIQRPGLVNVAVFLDEVTEFNGPLTFVPRSQHNGLLAGIDSDGMPVGYEDAPGWMATLTATERFQIDHEVIRRLVRQDGMVSPKGPAGSVMFFHPNILHASAPNMSPFDRSVLILVYNTVGNPPTNEASPRPEFLAEHRVVPLVPASD